ncbi:MAG: DUF2786 domain-containing protein, partial [Oligoflexia bacterium]|nr:DUF2786 domain-containing protein [Oligoflexia bacterium]
FLSKIRSYIREILTQEMNLRLTGKNYFSYSSRCIPFSVVVFEDNERLGFFEGPHYLIGINKSLIYNAKTTVLKNVLRHELAHFIVYLKYIKSDIVSIISESDHWNDYSKNIRDHGEEFKDVCRSYNWDMKEIMSATANINLQNENLEGDLESEKIIAKVKKLLALTQSSNQHEAELATLKANQLLIKYNLKDALDHFDDNMNSLKNEIENYAYVKRVLSAKRTSAKMRAILAILRNFLVYPILNYGDGVVDLEVTGSRTNVLLADYVASFLDRELDYLWEQVQKENHQMRGIRHKNSFMFGISEGYNAKMLKANEQYDKKDQRALILLKEDLTKKIKMSYGRLGSVKSSSTIAHDSRELGRKAGNNLNIHSGIGDNNNSASSKTVFLLE